LLGLILVKVLAPGFYARQNVRTPVKIALLTLICHPGAQSGLDRLAEACRPGAVHRTGCLPQCRMLYRGLRRHGIYAPQPGWQAFSLKLALALSIMAMRTLVLQAAIQSDGCNGTLSIRLLATHGIVIFGAGIYFATLWLIGFRLRDFRRRAAE
jgi:putative peptidoglycan lipid II flippase